MRMCSETGAQVYMYKNQPGIYYMGDDEPVSSVMAAAVGFDTKRHAAERKVQLAMATAKKETQLEFSLNDAEVLEEAAGFKLVRYGHDNYNVEGPMGKYLNPSPLPQALAKRIFDKATAPEEEEVAPKLTLGKKKVA